MHFINPFKGLRPIKEKASSVSIPSTDHLSEKVILNHKKNNPWSYLNIFNPGEKNLKSQSLLFRAFSTCVPHENPIDFIVITKFKDTFRY